MTSGISGPEGVDPQGSKPQDTKVPTGMTKMYTAAKAPGFAQMLEHWFPGQVTPKMVTAFEQGVMQMISNSISRSKAQHEKVERRIKKRIDQDR